MGKNFVIWFGILLGVLVLYQFVATSLHQGRHLNYAYSDFLDRVRSGQVRDVTIRQSPEEGTVIFGHLDSGQEFRTQGVEDPNLVSTLRENNVKIAAEPASTTSPIISALLSSWPFLILIAVYIYFMRQMQSGRGGGAMGFGKSKARMLTEMNEKVMFDDVAGVDEAKEDLVEIVDFLKDPQKFQRLGGKIPKGCLLVGPPGTGKTLLARAIAGEAGVPFFTISGSDFVEMFVGVGASRVRDMFEQGKKNAPCIIFIDEIDAVGRHRGAGMGGGNDEREQTLNQLLVEMDGFEANEGVILIAATNRPDVLDPALLRPGRFDRQIVVPNPDIEGRTKILSVHLKKVPLAPDVDASVIARGTPGFSGADLANLVNEAALLAARLDKKVVTMKELEAAKDKVMMGAERKSMVMSDDEKEMTAYHEAGHAIVGLACPASDPIHKATIIPRGRALGMVMRLPESDKISYKRDKMYADLAVAMGGRVAEELIFGDDKVSSGASSDIQYATKLARAMVSEWGLSGKLGPVHYADENSEPFLGQMMGRGSSGVSPDTARLIDEEVKHLVEGAHQQATQILKDRMEDLHALAKGLLEYETLTGHEIEELLNGNPPHRTDLTELASKTRQSTLPGRRAKKKATSKADKEQTAEKESDQTDNPPKDGDDEPTLH